MGLPTVEKFLCCCDLKTGTLIIGVINLVYALILAAISLFFLGTTIFATVLTNASWSSSATISDGNSSITIGELHDNLRDLGNTFRNLGDEEGQQIGKDLDDAINQFNAGKTGANVALGFAIAMSAIMLILCLGLVIVTSMLIHGARKGRPGLLMPWIVLTIISFIYYIVRIIGFFVSGNYGQAGSTVFALVIGIYLWIVVWSFREQLKGQLGAVPVPKA